MLSPYPVRSQRSRVRDDMTRTCDMLYTYNMYMCMVHTPHIVRSQRARNDVVNNRCLHGRYAFLSMAPSPAAKVLRRVTGLSLWSKSPARVAPRRQQPKPIERTVPGLFSIADAKPPAKPSPIPQGVECCICLESIEKTRAPAAQHPVLSLER